MPQQPHFCASRNALAALLNGRHVCLHRPQALGRRPWQLVSAWVAQRLHGTMRTRLASLLFGDASEPVTLYWHSKDPALHGTIACPFGRIRWSCEPL